jgi:hypothetical protein
MKLVNSSQVGAEIISPRPALRLLLVAAIVATDEDTLHQTILIVVRAPMPCQIVRRGKLLVAVWVGASVGFIVSRMVLAGSCQSPVVPLLSRSLDIVLT